MVGSIRMLAFAGARDVIGKGELELELHAASTADEVLSLVCERHPGLVPYRASLRIAINGAYASREDSVRPGDEVALIPPVAGG